MSLAAEMKNVEPRADLPLVHMHTTTNAMPTRSPRPGQPRNLTGLFLGKDVKEKTFLPSPTTRMMPAHCRRGRAMPSKRSRTPTEERRYTDEIEYFHLGMEHSDLLSNRSDAYGSYQFAYVSSNVPHFPPMPPSRYPLMSTQKKVELLRVKEERRGFSGNPVKNRPRGTSATEESEVASTEHGTPTTDFWDITRQTNRQFTLTKNSGISHLEYLAPDPHLSSYPGTFDQTLDSTLAHEVQQARDQRKEAIGLIHCYNKICKGNRDALHSLLPLHQSPGGATDSFRSTGFSVKSYRSPQKAEILGHFPTPASSRPRTVDMLLHNRRPLVPSPYFFKTYKSPRPGGPQTVTENIMHIPGAGQLSKTVSHAQQYNGHHTQKAESRPVHNKLQEVSMVTLPQAPTSTPSPSTLHGNRHTQSSDKVTSYGKVEISLPSVNKQDLSSGGPDNSLDTAGQLDGNNDNGDHSNNENENEESKNEHTDMSNSKFENGESNQNQDGNIGVQDSPDVKQDNKESENGTQDNKESENGNQDNKESQNATPDNGACPDGTEDNKEGVDRDVQPSPGTQADEVEVKVAPAIVIAEADATEDAHIANDPLTVTTTEGGQNIQVVMKGQNRKEEIAKLMTEHAEIVQGISTAEKSQPSQESDVDTKDGQGGSAESPQGTSNT